LDITPVEASSDEVGLLMKPMNRQQALRKLGSVPIGRIVFTRRAMPVISPVVHLLDNDQIIIRSHEGSAIAAGQGQGAVVVYEADELDPITRTGWSVMVTGLARLVTDPGVAARYRQALRPWVAGPMNHVIGIDPQIITGFELTAEHEDGDPR
jgi:Pyridoxamine 5'-phosphate oxidase